MSARPICADTDFSVDCGCPCYKRPCFWPECGCVCKPECKGCAEVAAARGGVSPSGKERGE